MPNPISNGSTTRTLTVRALNRALLARQGLLERSPASLTRMIEATAGLQTQYAPSAYIGLWSRVEGFRRADLTRALERRSVVQGTLMRETIHMVSRRDYWPLAMGVRDARRRWWLRVAGGRQDARTMAAAARRLRAFLADGPRNRRDISEALAIDSATWTGISCWIDLVRVPPSGTWDRRRADLYGLAEQWVGPCHATQAEGFERLVRRHLGAFGPASVRDIARWAGVPAPTLAATIGTMRLRRFSDERGQELMDLPRAPLPDEGTDAPVRFLGTWDAMLLVHARRTGILPEEHRERVFHTKVPQSVMTFLVDGEVAGSWRFEAGRVRLTAFRSLARTDRRELAEEGERLADLMA